MPATEDPIIKLARSHQGDERQTKEWLAKLTRLLAEYDNASPLSRGKIPDRNRYWKGRVFDTVSELRLHMQGRRK